MNRTGEGVAHSVLPKFIPMLKERRETIWMTSISYSGTREVAHSTLVDTSSHSVAVTSKRTRFPGGTTLESGETIKLRVGDGPRVSGSDLVIGSGSPLLNNGGDTIVVLDGSGNTVVTESYGDGG